MRNPRLWFCVPIYGREQLTAICLRQLRRTCDALTAEGIDATAVIIGDEANLAQAPDLGFATVNRSNEFLGRKFNDGISLALDERYNPAPADYVVPFGSDDWVDHRALYNLPRPDQVICFQHVAVVREDGREIATTRMASLGGAGIRIYPRQLLEPTGYRPADEDRRSGCDTSILVRLMQKCPRVQIEHRYVHDCQIVDWKSAEQLHPYSEAVRLRRGTRSDDPFETLADTYPAEALDEMRDYYAQTWQAAA